MNDIIKQRIDTIRRGEVPDGYKNTNAGIVPSAWCAYFLSDLLDFKNGINADGGQFGTGVKIIGVNEILSGKPIIYDSIRGLIDIDQQTLESYSVEYGDVLFQRSSENYEDAGTANIYLDRSRSATFGGFVIRGKKKADYDPVYLNGLLQTNAVRKEIIRRAAGAQHVNVGQTELSKVQVNVATKLEQQKIADILTTCDKVIELKEKLLIEKQRQKKYLMQQLLTGKKRLKGFSGEWKKTKLRSILRERKKYSQKGLEYPHVTLSTEGIYSKNERYDRDHLVKSEEKEYKVTHNGDICYNPANLKFGVICLNSFGDAIFSPIYVTFEVKGTADTLFIANYVMRWDFINAVRKFEEGTVYERMAVKPEDFLKYEILLPPIKEQNAIVEILSSADRELALLQQSLESEKQKKKALMQLLLTGIVRAIPEGGEANGN